MSNPDKSSDIKLLQFLNIRDIVVTSDVSKLLRSKDAIFEHPANIIFILVTLDVTKLETSKDVKVEQLPNMLSIFVTFDVSKALSARLFSFVQL